MARERKTRENGAGVREAREVGRKEVMLFFRLYVVE
jgi:hypothetical protein